MNPRSTYQFRRLTGLAFASWALFSIGLSAFSIAIPRDGPVIPLNCALIGGATLVQYATDEALGKGVEFGDRLNAVDGVPVLRVMSRGWHNLDVELPNIYEIEKRDGRILHVSLYPAPSEFAQRVEDLLLYLAILLVSLLYVAIGCAVWWSKPDRAEAWAFVLFC